MRYFEILDNFLCSSYLGGNVEVVGVDGVSDDALDRGPAHSLIAVKIEDSCRVSTSSEAAVHDHKEHSFRRCFVTFVDRVEVRLG